MNTHQEHVCGVIAGYYGKGKQTIQAVQELSELICVLTRRPDQQDEHHKENMLDEIADCEIMLEQIRRLYEIPQKRLENRITDKLDRQLARIASEKRAAGME